MARKHARRHKREHHGDMYTENAAVSRPEDHEKTGDIGSLRETARETTDYEQDTAHTPEADKSSSPGNTPAAPQEPQESHAEHKEGITAAGDANGPESAYAQSEDIRIPSSTIPFDDEREMARRRRILEELYAENNTAPENKPKRFAPWASDADLSNAADDEDEPGTDEESSEAAGPGSDDTAGDVSPGTPKPVWDDMEDGQDKDSGNEDASSADGSPAPSAEPGIHDSEVCTGPGPGEENATDSSDPVKESGRENVQETSCEPDQAEESKNGEAHAGDEEAGSGAEIANIIGPDDVSDTPLRAFMILSEGFVKVQSSLIKNHEEITHLQADLDKKREEMQRLTVEYRRMATEFENYLTEFKNYW